MLISEILYLPKSPGPLEGDRRLGVLSVSQDLLQGTMLHLAAPRAPLATPFSQTSLAWEDLDAVEHWLGMLSDALSWNSSACLPRD